MWTGLDDYIGEGGSIMKPYVVFFSDFGIDSGLVASMHGVAALVDPELKVCDATHLLPAFDIRAASFCLQYIVPYWPEGTVFVSVVDPGVGTDRKACVAKLKNGSYVVTPDNGTLTFLAKNIGISEIREIDETINRYQQGESVNVFHGRDIFAYCGARLASGVISFEEVGPAYAVEEMVQHKIYEAEVKAGYAKGVIESHDPYGTAETNILNADFAKTEFQYGDALDVKICESGKEIFHEKTVYAKTFGDVEVGKTLVFQDLASYISFGVNERSFFREYGLEDGKVYDIEITRG